MIEFLSTHTIGLGLSISMVVNLFLGFMQIRSGGYSIRKQIAEDYKERNGQLQDKIKELEVLLHQTQNQISELRGILTSKDKHIESLTAILKDKNPETINLLVEIKSLNSKLIDFMTTANAKTSEELGYQTRMLEKREKADNEAGNVV